MRTPSPRRWIALLAAAAWTSCIGVVPVRAAAYDVAHMEVSTRNATAQRHFDEALTLLDAFNPGEAIRRFESAARDDPSLAMAYWGIALAYGPNINTDYSVSDAAKARAALASARAREPGASEVERALIAALERRSAVRTAKDVDAAQHRYSEAMAAAAQRFSGDDNVAVLYAESLMDLQPWDTWSPDGKPNGDTSHIVRLLNDVLVRDPGNVQANHLLIHMIEASPHPQDGLPSAHRLAALSFEPGAEHLVHMPAHIYDRVGDFPAAIASSNDAIAHFRSYLAASHAPGHDGYLWHDAGVLLTAQMSAGARRAALANATSDPLDGDATARLRVEERFHLWRRLLDDGDTYGRALALAQTGSPERAAALAAKLGSDDRGKLGPTIVRAEASCARGDVAGSIAIFEDAVRQQDALGYGEPPAWYFPVRESLGARLLQLGRAAQARRIFEVELEHDPGNPRALYGLSRALDASGAPAPERAAAAQAFRRAWANADVPLTLEDLA